MSLEQARNGINDRQRQKWIATMVMGTRAGGWVVRVRAGLTRLVEAGNSQDGSLSQPTMVLASSL